MAKNPRTQNPTNTSPGNSESNRVVDFNKMRESKLEEKRKTAERIFFKHLLGIYCVSGDQNQMRPIELLDVSEDGLSFQVPFDPKLDWGKETKELPLRLYFSQDTYIPLIIQIQNSRQMIQDGVRYLRYGCRVDSTIQAHEAYLQFVRFLKTFSEHAHKDVGGVSVFYL